MSEGLPPIEVTEQAGRNTFLQDVLAGLAQEQKTLPCKYFYDQRGSQLFDRICELEEYYPTRTELAIMRAYGPDIGALIGPDTLVIELGSGNNVKIRLLLDALASPAGYVPIDISRTHLETAARDLQRDYPGLPIYPLWADYHAAITLPAAAAAASKRLVYFPGSTIGNFFPEDAVGFLKRVARLAGPGSHLLIGVDVKKQPAVLERAYDDAEGVTAAFNKNVLRRINNELGGNFPEERFRHWAAYNAEAGRIEMHLVSERDCVIHIGGREIPFRAGESIRTECSYKYTPEEFAELAGAAGFVPEAIWTDAGGLFSVQLLRVTDRRR